MDASLIVALVTAIVGPALGALLAFRKTSGRVRSSDASELWDEARAIRHECAERVKALESLVGDQQAEIYRLQRQVAGGGGA